MYLPFTRWRFLRIFTIHQRKGGIHEIYRSFMDTFGWYRLAGVRSIKISADKGQGAIRRGGWLFYLTGFQLIVFNFTLAYAYY